MKERLSKVNIIKSINKEEFVNILNEMYFVDKMSFRDIAQIFNVKKQIVSGWFRLYKINTRNLKEAQDIIEKNREYKIFTERQKQILLGGMLGDGGLRRYCGRNAAYIEYHCWKQKGYVIWKARELNVKSKTIWRNETRKDLFNRKFGRYKQAWFKLNSHPFLTDGYNKIYIDNKKTKVTKDFMDKLDVLGLAVWYMDDGYYDKKSKRAFIFFGFQNPDIILDYFKEKFKLFPKIQERSGGGYSRKFYTLRFNSKESCRFIKIIRKYVAPIKCMRYKIGF